MKEDWMDILGYEGKYQVSSMGNVRSLRYAKKSGVVKNLRKIKNSCNYYVVSLHNKGIQKQYFVHRLVAVAFLNKPNKCDIVDHIDTNTLNNDISNLRWTTIHGNVNNPITKERRIKSIKRLMGGKYGEYANKHRSVMQYDLTGNLIKEWGSMSDACRFYKIDSGGMTKACQGTQKTAGGFIWRYKNN